MSEVPCRVAFLPLPTEEGAVRAVARVVLAMEEHDVAEEVMQFLDRSGVARVVATAADDRQLTEAVRQLEPDLVVAQPALSDGLVGSAPVLAVDTRETVASLRGAIRVGALGFFVWPGEREALVGAAAASMPSDDEGQRRAVVVAVHASRGGAGCTFVATNLAAALARRAQCILIEADPAFGDATPAIGAPPEGVRTSGDLAPLGDEMSPEHLDDALWTHPSGFRALLAPPVEEAPGVDARLLGAAARVAATQADAVVLHLPRALEGSTSLLGAGADRWLEVLSLDVASFRATQRAMDSLDRERVELVVNRATTGRGHAGRRRARVRRTPGRGVPARPFRGSGPRPRSTHRSQGPAGQDVRTTGRAGARAALSFAG